MHKTLILSVFLFFISIQAFLIFYGVKKFHGEKISIKKAFWISIILFGWGGILKFFVSIIASYLFGVTYITKVIVALLLIPVYILVIKSECKTNFKEAVKIWGLIFLFFFILGIILSLTGDVLKFF